MKKKEEREYNGPISIADTERLVALGIEGMEDDKEATELPPEKRVYTEVDKRTSKQLYYLLGPERTLHQVCKLMEINISSLKQWATAGHWQEYVKERDIADEHLAQSGKFGTQILAQNAKAKVVLELILEKYMEKLLGKNGHLMTIQSSDALNAAKALMSLMDNDKESDVIIKGNIVKFIKEDES